MTARTDFPTRKPRAPKPFRLVERDDAALHTHTSVDAALCAALPLLVRVVRQQQEAGMESDDGFSVRRYGVGTALAGVK